MQGISLPFSFSCPISDVVLDSVSFSEAIGFDFRTGVVDTALSKGLVATLGLFGGQTEGLIATLHFSVTPSPDM